MEVTLFYILQRTWRLHIFPKSVATQDFGTLH